MNHRADRKMIFLLFITHSTCVAGVIVDFSLAVFNLSSLGFLLADANLYTQSRVVFEARLATA